AITRVGDDNADGLISPYQVERDAIVDNLNTVLAWLDRERTGRNAELWMTEGFDDSFRELRGSRQELFERAKEVLLQSVDVPSLRLRFQ
ncbi:MAG TPA: hypothetical protein VFQ61_02685, partial [Polyangiaceae bacterium]|nr:hypothetical protein [Polyangiaceae bacterium]